MHGREHFKTKKDIVWIENVIKKIRTMNNSISFNEDEHRYFYRGEEMVSVSKRIEFMSGGTLAMANTEIMQNAMQRGTAVHYLTEQHDLDIKPINLETAHEEIAPYLRAYLKYLAENDPIYIGVEQKVAVNSGQTCGTIDRIYIKKTDKGDLRIGILDIKTGAHNHKNAFQITLYAQMLRSVTGIKSNIEKTLLYIDRLGKYKIRRIM